MPARGNARVAMAATYLMPKLFGAKYLLCPARKVAFAHIEKSGVESLRYLVLQEEGEPAPERIWEPRMKRYVVRRRRPPDGYAYVAVVRNPYSRLVSSYIRKFLTGNFHSLPFCEEPMRRYGRRMDDDRRVSFEELVRFLVSRPPALVDAHFRPQTRLIGGSGRARLLKLEDGGIDDALRELGFTHRFVNYRDHHLQTHSTAPVPDAHRLHYREFDIAERRTEPVEPEDATGVGFQGATVPRYEDFYTEELRQLVYAYFREDFEAFGYGPDVPGREDPPGAG